MLFVGKALKQVLGVQSQSLSHQSTNLHKILGRSFLNWIHPSQSDQEATYCSRISLSHFFFQLDQCFNLSPIPSLYFRSTLLQLWTQNFFMHSKCLPSNPLQAITGVLKIHINIHTCLVVFSFLIELEFSSFLCLSIYIFLIKSWLLSRILKLRKTH